MDAVQFYVLLLRLQRRSCSCPAQIADIVGGVESVTRTAAAAWSGGSSEQGIPTDSASWPGGLRHSLNHKPFVSGLVRVGTGRAGPGRAGLPLVLTRKK